MTNRPEPEQKIDVEHSRLDRTTITVFSSFAAADAADKAYWLSRSPHDRVRHMEALRRMNYGSRATARLQRVLEFATR